MERELIMNYFNQPELLSPVGNWDSLYAAVQNGCDAIYIGGKKFNARNRANNFSISELKDVIDYAHIRGVKVYITANILYKEEEVNQVLGFIKKVYNYGADAIIVQDLGIAKLITDFFPDIELHASTQLSIHNLAGAKMLEKLGFSRVILARELSLEKIKYINDNTSLKVETFVHGALCISYSGQCLMSSLIGGRSGNRGRCAQPCRMPYTLIDRDTGEIIDDKFSKQHLLSPKDINTLELIPELIKAGIASFKIEGRLKRPEYTALVTKTYRKYIEQYFHNRENYSVKQQDQQKLTQLFNRNGFIPSYYQGKEDLDLISYQRPKNWGIKVGKVSGYDQNTKKCYIEVEEKINPGDGIEIWTKQGENIGLTISELRYKNDQLAIINLDRKVKEGALVYRTSDKQLLDSLAQSYQNPDTLKKIEVFGTITAKIDQELKLDLWDQDGYFITAQLDSKPEVAKNHPLTAEDLEEQISKLGSSPYSLEKLNFDIDSKLFIPISKLNQLRRKAVSKLNQARKKGETPQNRRDQFSAKNLRLKNTAQDNNNDPNLTITINDQNHLETVLKLGVDRVYCSIKNLNLTKLNLLLNNKQNTEIFIKLPRIEDEKEMENLELTIEKLEATNIDGYLISQLGTINLVDRTDKSLVADFPLNTFNHHSIKLWEKMGIKTVTLSPELSLKEMKKLTMMKKPTTEIIVYGYLPMMISEYCPIGAVERKFDFSQSCEAKCSQRNYGLLDRKEMVEPIETDSDSCRSIIYNSQPLHLLNYLNEIKKTGSENIRLNFTIETEEEIIKVIEDYKRKLENTTQKISSSIKDYTTGHFYRGVK